MRPELGFLGLLLTTVAFLVAVAVSGRRGLLRIHLTCVALALASLAGAIVFALRVGELYDLDTAGVITPVHLTLARITTLAFLWPLVTGPLYLRGKVTRGWHAFGAYLALVLTGCATITGVLMMAGAERIG